MKKQITKIGLKAIIVLVATLCLVGCDETCGYGLSKKSFDGHTYIVYRAGYGVCILHDVDCEKCLRERDGVDERKKT